MNDRSRPLPCRRTALRHAAAALAGGAFAPWLSGCAALAAPAEPVLLPPEVLRSSARVQKEYLIAPGDQLEIVVWRVPEASRVVLVRPDGMISLPLVQDLRAAGLTPRDLAAAVRGGLSARLVNPEVAVIPQQFRAATVYVLGDVKAPGPQPLRTSATALQALAAAGGALRSAGELDTVVVRLGADGHLQALPLVAGGGRTSVAAQMRMAATALEADDIVFVPESGRAEVVRLLSDLLLPLQTYLNFKLIRTLT